MTPVAATTAGRPGSRPRDQLPPPVPLEVDRHQPQPLGDAVPQLGQPLPLPGLRPGPVDLEHPERGGDVRPTLGEGVQSGSQEDVLVNAPRGLVHDEILHEAGAGRAGGAGAPRGLDVHVRAAAPVLVRGRQPQPDLVVDHMRRRIGLDVQGPPQGDPHGRVVRLDRLLVHAVASPSAGQPKSFEKSSSSLRSVSEYQLPLSSRKIASMPYGRSFGSWMNSTPRPLNRS